MKNIETFDLYSGYVFKLLYESFPVCRAIKFKYDFDEIKEGLGVEDIKQHELIFSETLFWLRDAGLIAFSGPKEKAIAQGGGVIPYNSFDCVVLSVKGLELLKKMPKSIEKRNNIGEGIVEAVKDGAKQKISELVSFALSQIVQG